MLFRTIASNKWQLSLGDITGAFLATGPLPERFRLLYARLPPGGIPGVPSDALIKVTGHVYGLNDSPSAWQQKCSYKSWLAPCFEKRSPQLQDLVKYLIEMRDPVVLAHVHGDMAVKIPGTDIPRRLG